MSTKHSEQPDETLCTGALPLSLKEHPSGESQSDRYAAAAIYSLQQLSQFPLCYYRCHRCAFGRYSGKDGAPGNFLNFGVFYLPLE